VRKKVAAAGAGAVMVLCAGAFGVDAARADPGEKIVKDYVHEFCRDATIQEAVGVEFNVKPNFGQCQQALRQFILENFLS
jgi:hypothetical protein